MWLTKFFICINGKPNLMLISFCSLCMRKLYIFVSFSCVFLLLNLVCFPSFHFAGLSYFHHESKKNENEEEIQMKKKVNKKMKMNVNLKEAVGLPVACIFLLQTAQDVVISTWFRRRERERDSQTRFVSIFSQTPGACLLKEDLNRRELIAT